MRRFSFEDPKTQKKRMKKLKKLQKQKKQQQKKNKKVKKNEPVVDVPDNNIDAVLVVNAMEKHISGSSPFAPEFQAIMEAEEKEPHQSAQNIMDMDLNMSMDLNISMDMDVVVKNKKKKWQYFGNNGDWAYYKPSISDDIEEAFVTEWEKYEFTITENHCRFRMILDFKKMEAENIMDQSFRPIRRIDG